MLPKTLIICACELLTASGALGWKHAGRDKFLEVTSGKEVSLVAFVAPWTESSKALEPEWLSATSQSPKELISVDCTAEAILCSEQGIISYPSIRVYHSNGNMKRYRGPRKATSIVSYMKRAELPEVSVLDHKNITSFKSVDGAVFIAYVTGFQHRLALLFAGLAKRYHDRYTFAMVTDSSLVKREGLQYPTIMCYKRSESKQHLFPVEVEVLDLEQWIANVTTPLVGEFTRRNEMKYLKAGKSVVYFFYSSSENRDEYVKSVTQLATTYQNQLTFVTVDAVEHRHTMPKLGLDAGAEPALAVFNPTHGHVFPFENEGQHISAKDVENFMHQISLGKIQPWTGKKEDGEEEEKEEEEEEEEEDRKSEGHTEL
ncbi:hypothetical protein BUE80_DR009202 [Diplocarpon rosae]|nr:hypothetical protein BUE80_DR009202 [Diplocarpon rosae]